MPEDPLGARGDFMAIDVPEDPIIWRSLSLAQEELG